MRLYQTCMVHGLKVCAIATTFEHLEHNTLDNLQRLLKHGELLGGPLSQLAKAGFAEDGRLPSAIPFRVAMDKLVHVIEHIATSNNSEILPEFITDTCAKMPHCQSG